MTNASLWHRRKGVLLVSAALLLAAAIAATAWLSLAPDLRARGKEVIRAGAAFARGRDADACVDEALRRASMGDGVAVLREAEARSFLAACLRVARPTHAACSAVPPRADRGAFEPWARGACAGRAPSDVCFRLIGEVQRACQRP